LPERVLFRFAAATSKAVALALVGVDLVCDNERPDTDFGADDAASVLLGVSALLEHGPKLVEDIRSADNAVRFSQEDAQ